MLADNGKIELFNSCMRTFLIFILSVCCSGNILAQFSISNSISLTADCSETLGCGLSYFDFNNDGWDDVTVCSGAYSILIFENNHNNGFDLVEQINTNQNGKQPVWVDYDNDNDYDLFVTFYMGSCCLYRNDGELSDLEDVTENLNLPAANANSYGSAWADYDNDGYLDVHINNYQLPNAQISSWLLHNEGDGTFTNVSYLLMNNNVYSTPFQSSWCDFDNNGWQDLYITYDHSEGNELFMNYNGIFVNEASLLGADVQLNSMSNSIADYDQDGDFDIYITNTNQGNVLLKQNAWGFENVAMESNTSLNLSCWSSLWLDANNDGFEDLFVCVADGSVNNKLLMNNTMGEFELFDLAIEMPLNVSFTCAKGDFNNDNSIDLCNFSQITPLITVYENSNKNQNSWIKLELDGVISNKDAVGARIEIFCQEKYFNHYTFCGNNYISQDSQYKIIGLGNSSIIDSLVITWPSGWVDTFYDLPANQVYALEEGQSLFAQLPNHQTIIICNSQQVTLSMSNFAAYEWSNGQSTSSVVVNEIGDYSVTVTTVEGFAHTFYFTVDVEDLVIGNVMVTEPNCSGNNTGSIELLLNYQNYQTVSWSKNGEELLDENNLLSNITSGIYEYEITTNKNCTYTGSVQVNEPAPLAISWNAPAACYGGTTSIVLEVLGGIGNYSFNWYGINPDDVTAGQYEVIVTDANECAAAQTIYVQQYQPINISFNTPLACYEQATQVQAFVTGGAGNFELDWSGANPEEIYAGAYTVLATDIAGCTASANFTILQSTEIIVTAQITDANGDDDGSIQLTVTDGYAPYSYAWNNGATTSGIEDVEQGVYTCTITDALQCSQQITVQVINTKINEIENNIIAYPNPCSDRLNIQLPTPQDIRIYNANGQLVYQAAKQNGLVIIDTSRWSGGVYSLVGNCNMTTILIQ